MFGKTLGLFVAGTVYNMISWLIEKEEKVPLTLLVFCQLLISVCVKSAKHFMPLLLYNNIE